MSSKTYGKLEPAKEKKLNDKEKCTVSVFDTNDYIVFCIYDLSGY